MQVGEKEEEHDLSSGSSKQLFSNSYRLTFPISSYILVLAVVSVVCTDLCCFMLYAWIMSAIATGELTPFSCEFSNQVSTACLTVLTKGEEIWTTPVYNFALLQHLYVHWILFHINRWMECKNYNPYIHISSYTAM